MRRARDSLRLLIRLGSLPECTQPASQAAAAGFAQPRSTPAAVLAGRLWQAGAQQAAAHYHSPSCSRQLLLGVRSAGQTGRPYRLGTRRGFSSEAPQSSEAASEARMMDLMSKRLGGRATDQMLYGVAIAIAMVGVTYGAVPLYRLFCQATGYGGTVQEGATVEAKLKARQEAKDAELEAACAARELTVYFNADVNDQLPWKFAPTQRSVKIHPGQSTLAFYTAQNLSDKAITGVSTYNVTPQSAGLYFNKIQCFCFEEQKLQPGEKIDMPVFFYVDPEFATDIRLQNINNLTLSYTFFKVSEEEPDEQPAAVAVAAQ